MKWLSGWVGALKTQPRSVIAAFIYAMNLLTEKSIITTTSNWIGVSNCKLASISNIEDK
jgi:hypothetical protein